MQGFRFAMALFLIAAVTFWIGECLRTLAHLDTIIQHAQLVAR